MLIIDILITEKFLHIVEFEFSHQPNCNQQSGFQSGVLQLTIKYIINLRFIQSMIEHDHTGVNPGEPSASELSLEIFQRIYRYPARQEEAIAHRNANKFGYKSSTRLNKTDDQKQKKSLIPICPCCRKFIATYQIPICYATYPSTPELKEQFFLLPAGVSIYFTIIKIIIGYLLLRFLILDIYNIQQSITANFCANLFKSKSNNLCWITVSAYAMKSAQDQQTLNSTDLLSLAITVISLVYFWFWRVKLYNIFIWLRNCKDISQENYTIFIEGIPLTHHESDQKCIMSFNKQATTYDSYIKQKIEKKILEWREQFETNSFQSKAKSQNFNKNDDLQSHFYEHLLKTNKKSVQQQDIVFSISPCYDLSHIHSLNRLRQQTITTYLTQKKNGLNAQDPSAEIDKINNQVIDLCYSYLKGDTDKSNLASFTGKAYVTFQYQHYRNYFLREYHKDPNFLTFNDRPVKISVAERPNDINWHNIAFVGWKDNLYLTYFVVIQIIIFFLAFVALFAIELWQMSQFTKSKTDQIRVQNGLIFTLIVSLVTTAINYVIRYSIEAFTDIMKHPSKTQKMRRQFVYVLIAQTFVYVFIQFFLYIIYPINPLSNFGLANKLMGLVTISGFLHIVLQTLQPIKLIKLLLQNIKQDKRSEKQVLLTQIQLNEQKQLPQFDFSKRYAFYIGYLYLVSFHSILTPLATPLLVLIFFIQYWVDKFLIFKRSSMPVDIDEVTFKIIFASIEISVVFNVLGSAYWCSAIHYDSSPIFIICRLLSILLVAFYAYFSYYQYEDMQEWKNIEFTNFRSFAYYFIERGDKIKTIYHRQNPATFCLQENRLTMGGKKYKTRSRLKLPTQDEINKYLDVTNDELRISLYRKEDVELYYQFMSEEYSYIDRQSQDTQPRQSLTQIPLQTKISGADNKNLKLQSPEGIANKQTFFASNNQQISLLPTDRDVPQIYQPQTQNFNNNNAYQFRLSQIPIQVQKNLNVNDIFEFKVSQSAIQYHPKNIKANITYQSKLSQPPMQETQPINMNEMLTGPKHPAPYISFNSNNLTKRQQKQLPTIPVSGSINMNRMSRIEPQALNYYSNPHLSNISGNRVSIIKPTRPALSGTIGQTGYRAPEQQQNIQKLAKSQVPPSSNVNAYENRSSYKNVNASTLSVNHVNLIDDS